MAASDAIRGLQALVPFWHTSEHQVLLASRIKFLRNISAFAFLTKAEPKVREQLLQLLSHTLLEHANLEQPKLLLAKELGGEDKEFLFERFLLFEGLNHAYSDEAFVIDRSGQLIAMINVIEQLQLQLLAPGDRLESLFAQLLELERQLSRSLDFSYQTRFGFLTARARHCGTGLVASLLLHLPALLEQGLIEKSFKECAPSSVQLLELGKPHTLSAGLVLVQNGVSIGFCEEELLGNVQKVAHRMAGAEIDARKHLQTAPTRQLLDKIARSFGLVKHAYSLSTQEAMDALSVLHLGFSIGLVSGLQASQITRLLFEVQRGQLKFAAAQEDGCDLERTRARFLQRELACMQLLL